MLVHLDGSLVPPEHARVSVFDRGFLFGDGVYEGIRAFGGWIRNLDDHAARMAGGLRAASIDWDTSRLRPLCEELLEANGLRDAFLYWQVTRGAPLPGQPLRARIPGPGVPPTVFGYCLPLPSVDELVEPDSCSAVTIADERWLRGHVKTTSLMANVMAAIEALDAGGDEAVLVRDGLVSESCATNVFVVGPDGDIATPPLDEVSILAGVTRKLLLEIAPEIRVRSIRAEELRSASELFVAGTMTTVKSVVRLDGAPVGAGTVGPVARRTLALYAEHVRSQIGAHA